MIDLDVKLLIAAFLAGAVFRLSESWPRWRSAVKRPQRAESAVVPAPEEPR